MMTIEQKISDFEVSFGIKLPSFYIGFLKQHQLADARLFSDLTWLHGYNDVAVRQTEYEIQKYLPGYVNIGNDSGDFGIFINCRPNSDDHIYITEMGNLDETSLEKLAENFTDWAAKNYDTEQFLLNIYENRVTSPLLQLKQEINLINIKITDLNKTRNDAFLA